MKVADTTLLIAHARGEPAAGTYLEAHENETLVAPAIAFGEIAVGEIAVRGASIDRVLRDLGSFDVRSFTADHAYHAAAIEADLRTRGAFSASLTSDVQIGGVGRSLGVPVVTENTDHFDRFDGVTVESY